MNILGISAFYHDSAACLVKDGKILFAAEEERYTRKKHDFSFPKNAINSCLDENKICCKDLDLVVFYDKPFLKFERILHSYLAYAPIGIRSFIQAIPTWIKKKIWIKDFIKKEFKYDGPLLFTEHHEAHAASAFFPSPFKESAFLTIDGVGEWTTTSYGIGKDNKIKILSEIHFPHSLGLFYSAFTYYTGFKVNNGEYKMMGLSPYGEPKYKDLILSELIDLKNDGSFRLNMEYFDFCAGLRMINKKFMKLFGFPPRKKDSEISQEYMDLACSAQLVLEEIIMKIIHHIYKETGLENICLAGGVALNCVANGKILRDGPFKNIWIQPASGDSGGALGAALFTWFQYLGNKRIVDGKNDIQQGSYLGPKYDNSFLKEYLINNNIPFNELSNEEIPENIADLIANQKVVGLFHGRMEFGPRALGNRSIVGDARSPLMQKRINQKVKFREDFRPFAPSVIYECVEKYFDIDIESPYMLFIAKVKKEHHKSLTNEETNIKGLKKLNVIRSNIPAVTHVDYSSRIHTVKKDKNLLFYQIIKKFEEKYNYPLIINTSFNIRGEPIVCTPEDAYSCFKRTEMDYLLLGNFLIKKNHSSS